jgi:hypothetical protein
MVAERKGNRPGSGAFQEDEFLLIPDQPPMDDIRLIFPKG